MEDSVQQCRDYKTLFKNMPDAGGLLDVKGRFLLVTKAFEKLMGKKEKDLIGKNAYKSGFFKKDFEDIAFKNMQKWLAAKVLPVHDIELFVKGGKIRIYQTSSSVVSYDNKKSFLFMLRDVTDQRAAEKKLEVSEKKYRNILDTTTDIIWEVDALGRLVFISGRIEELLGYKPEEVMGKKPYFFMRQDVKNGTKKDFHNHLLKRENISEHETIIKTKNGEEKIFLTNGMPFFDEKKNFIGYRGIEKDVTIARHAERKLAENEKRFKDILLSNAGWIWEIDKNGKYIYVAGKVKESIGYDPSELIGKTPFDLVAQRDRRKTIAVFNKKVKKGENIVDFENINIKKNGERVVLQTNGVPIFNEKGKVVGYRGVDKDITARKRVEERFKELFNNMKSGVVIYRTEDNGKSFIVSEANKAAETIEKVKKEYIVGKDFLLVFPGAKDSEILASFQRVHDSGKSEFFSIVLNNGKEGESWRDNFIYRLSSGEIVAIYEDVSEKIKINQELEERKQRFRKIFEASPEAIVILDHNAVVVDLNERVSEWLGYSADEVKGKNLLEIPFFTKEGMKMVIDKFKERMSDPAKGIQPYDLEFLNKEGKSFYGRIYTRVIRDSKGGHMQDLVMISDITKEKEDENSRNERNEQLEKMNRLMVGRELKMIELKGEVEKLKEKINNKN